MALHSRAIDRSSKSDDFNSQTHIKSLTLGEIMTTWKLNRSFNLEMLGLAHKIPSAAQEAPAARDSSSPCRRRLGSVNVCGASIRLDLSAMSSVPYGRVRFLAAIALS